MWLIRISLIFFAALFTTAGVILNYDDNTDELINGEWEEVAWVYEKVDFPNGSGVEIGDGQKSEICRSLRIHKAETWVFNKNGTLVLFSNNEEKERLTWNIKGRGNILELSHQDRGIEDFQIQQLSEDSLELHFNSDLQVRGIVKMKFKKKENRYAEEV